MNSLEEPQGDYYVSMPMAAPWEDHIHPSFEFHHAHTMSPTNLYSNPHSTSSSPSLNPPTMKKLGGVLSLHGYRKYLSQLDKTVPPDSPEGRRKLKRKNGFANLNLAQPRINSPPHPLSVAGSSVPSSPPPLSPSGSASVMSQQSEQESEGLSYLSVVAASSCPEVNNIPAIHKARCINKLNPFHGHERQKTSSNPFVHHSKSRSEADLLNMASSKIIISHDGTPFEMLNPRRSLQATRIVSFVEDAERLSTDTDDNQRYSYSFTDSERTVCLEKKPEGGPSELQTAETRASTARIHWPLLNNLPITYSRNENPKIPSPSPGMDPTNPFAALPKCRDLPRTPHHLIRPGPLSDQPNYGDRRERRHEHDGIQTFRQQQSPRITRQPQPMLPGQSSMSSNHIPNYHNQSQYPDLTEGTHLDLVGDSPNPPIPSIFERLKQQVDISRDPDASTSSTLNLTPNPSLNTGHGHGWGEPGLDTGMEREEIVIHTWLPKPGSAASKKRRSKEQKQQKQKEGRMPSFGLGWVSSLFKGGHGYGHGH